MNLDLVTQSQFLYRCADLLCRLAERVQKSQLQLTPELVLKECRGFSAVEMKNFGEVLTLLSVLMSALTVVRDSMVEELIKRIIDLEREKERRGGTHHGKSEGDSVQAKP